MPNLIDMLASTFAVTSYFIFIAIIQNCVNSYVLCMLKFTACNVILSCSSAGILHTSAMFKFTYSDRGKMHAKCDIHSFI